MPVQATGSNSTQKRARQYFDLGYWPFPLGHDKSPAVAGFSGYTRPIDVRVNDVIATLTEGSPLGISLPLGVVGLDVDSYEKGGKLKTGGTELVRLESELGALPPTWHSTRRGPQALTGPTRSGIYLFQLPAAVLAADSYPKLVSNPAPSLEVIQYHHRHLVVAPTVLDGLPYQWYDPTGVPVDLPPAVGDLPELPMSWVEKLFKPPTGTTWGAFQDEMARTEPAEIKSRRVKPRACLTGVAAYERLDVAEATLWAETNLKGWGDQPNEFLITKTNEAVAALTHSGSRHDDAVKSVWNLLCMAVGGEIGSDGQRTPGNAGGAWAVGTVGAELVRIREAEGDRSGHGEAERLIVGGIARVRDEIDRGIRQPDGRMFGDLGLDEEQLAEAREILDRYHEQRDDEPDLEEAVRMAAARTESATSVPLPEVFVAPATTALPSHEAGEPAETPTPAGTELASPEPTDAEKPEPLSAHDQAVLVELEKLKVRAQAREIYETLKPSAREPIPPFVSLTDFLAIPDEPVPYRIGNLMRTGSRVLLSAQYKSGKSTMIGNLIRSLVDGVPFLGVFPVEPFDGDVILIDNELDAATLRQWLREQGIRNTDRVRLVALRGHVSAFDILDPRVRRQWAEHIARADGAVVILDCLRPVLDALGLDENHDVGRLLVAFDALIADAGVGEAVVVHHMGHSGERSRGDSRLMDWPDSLWRVLRDKEANPDDPAAPRFFTAFGRDVDVKEGALSYSPATRALSYAVGDRKAIARQAAVTDIERVLVDVPAGLTQRGLEQALVDAGHTQNQARAAIKYAKSSGAVVVTKGARGAQIHTLPLFSASVRGSALDVERGALNECVSASIDAHALSAPPNPGIAGNALTVADEQAQPPTTPGT